MSQYKRCYQKGGYYFFTLVTYLRRPLFLNSEHVEYFKMSIKKVQKSHPFSLSAIVILHDHLHCIWKMPKNESDFSMRWRLIKRYFSMGIETPMNHRGEKEVWQRRFWEHAIRDEEDWIRHMDYIHYNPVKHGLAESPTAWKHSSFNHWVDQGVYEKDWGSRESILFAGMDEVE